MTERKASANTKHRARQLDPRMLKSDRHLNLSSRPERSGVERSAVCLRNCGSVYSNENHPETCRCSRRSLHSASLCRKSSWEACSASSCGLPPLLPTPSKLRLPGTSVTQGWGTLNLLEVWIQNGHQSRVPHIWRALCARCGKPQISPLRCAPVEMTKLGVIAAQTFLNPIFIPLGGPQAHEHSGRDDKYRWGGSKRRSTGA